MTIYFHSYFYYSRLYEVINLHSRLIIMILLVMSDE